MNLFEMTNFWKLRNLRRNTETVMARHNVGRDALRPANDRRNAS